LSLFVLCTHSEKIMQSSVHQTTTNARRLDSRNSALAPNQSSLISRNVTIEDHRTSVRLEPDMWIGLREICRRERASMHDICSAVAASKAPNTSLTAAIRVFIMGYFRAASTEDGHSKAGHGPGGSFMAMRKHTSASATIENANHYRSGRETSGFLSR
jgi:predicted DNA-binding ribbon-helix-helix protein